LIIPDLSSETWEPLATGAGEANSAITLAIGYRRLYAASRVVGSRAGVNRLVTTLPRFIWKAKGAHHIAIPFALPVHITDIALAHGARIAELQTDAVAFQDVALAISESSIDEAARRRAERVLLVLANHEGRFLIERRVQMETEGWYYDEELDDRDDINSFK
jgi:hypothetical protein